MLKAVLVFGILCAAAARNSSPRLSREVVLRAHRAHEIIDVTSLPDGFEYARFASADLRTCVACR